MIIAIVFPYFISKECQFDGGCYDRDNHGLCQCTRRFDTCFNMFGQSVDETVFSSLCAG